MLEVNQLTAGYGNEPVVCRLSFSANLENGPLILAGANGSGKSTLLKALLGLIPYKGSHNLETLKATSAGWLPQNFSVTLGIPVLDFITMANLNRQAYFPSIQKEARLQAEQILEELGISHLAYKRTDEISGGEWQLVCIAQIIAQKSTLIILDEPTASLDIGFKTRMFQILWALSAEGKKIILATHDLPFLPKKSGSILWMKGAETELLELTKPDLEMVVEVLAKK